MSKKLYISSYCCIKKNSVFVNGNSLYIEDNKLSFLDFSKAIYKKEEIKYSKFFKMDKLCKLSFLASEFVFNSIEKINENTAIVLSNNASSLDTDRKHQQSIQDKQNFFPSPAVFVYTLPNIAIGEISIKNQLKSENAFFVSEKLNEKLLFNYAQILIANKKANNVLCGWINFDENNYEAFLYLVSDKGEISHTIENIRKIHKT